MANARAWDIPGTMTILSSATPLLPPYPPGCHIASILVLLVLCCHWNTVGTAGGMLASLTPTVIAFTPAFTSSGIIDDVIPGTSRWLIVIVCGLPNLSSSRWVRFTATLIIRGFNRYSGWLLKGKACQVMSPCFTASIKLVLSSSLGQWRPILVGQSRYNDTR